MARTAAGGGGFEDLTVILPSFGAIWENDSMTWRIIVPICDL